ncbi:YbaN family protein [[Pseudomonas] boreopolis]|uniref:YbaN family protein n=1 Tax=Xanthomonas boreopolis TaxID=86183 RepID=UPI003DA1B82B
MTDPGSPAPDPGPSAVRPVRFRWAWWLLAYASLGTGIVGIFVPGLPTTVFILVAAWAATRGSEKLRHRLVTHPRFGPAILDWENHGAVSRRGKWMASLAMAACAAIVLAFVSRPWVWAVSIGPMAVVAIWLWLRPEPPRRDGP